MTTGRTWWWPMRARCGPLALPRHPRSRTRPLRHPAGGFFSAMNDASAHPHPARRPGHAGRRLPAPARGAGRAGVPARVGRARRAGRPLLVPGRGPADGRLARRGGRLRRRPARPGRRPAAVRRRRGRLPGLRLGDPARAGAAAGRRAPPMPACRVMRFMLADDVVAFDHVRRTMTVTGPRERGRPA